MTHSLMRAGLLAGAGNAGKYLAESAGYSPETGDKIKLGTMLGIGLIGRPKIEDYVSKQYDKAQSAVPVGTKYSDPIALKKLEKLELDLSKRTFEGKDKIKAALDTALANSSGGQFDFNDVMQARRDAGTFIPALERKGIARQELKKITDIYRESMNDAYKTVKKPTLKNALKEAASTSLEADKIYSAIKDYNEANSWWNTLINAKSLISPITTYLFGLPGAVVGGAATAGLHGKKLFDFVTKTPEVKQAYKNMYKAYASNNKDLAKKSLAIIDKKAAESFPELNENTQGTYTFLN